MRNMNATMNLAKNYDWTDLFKEPDVKFDDKDTFEMEDDFFTWERTPEREVKDTESVASLFEFTDTQEDKVEVTKEAKAEIFDTDFMKLQSSQTILNDTALEKLKEQHAADMQKEEEDKKKTTAYYIAHRLVSGTLLL
mmetsp:Transcript_1130/g.1573  ORF Transcript_1130/g.1573 Transcript_1130/m.1573 type:complete len:138 (-) Transcript_1130:88-501(-)